MGTKRNTVVLVADDDADDRLLTRDALVSRASTTDVRFVEDGVELLDYLRRRGRFAELVDLNMPRMGGSSYIRKPVAFGQRVEAMHVVTRHWLGLVEHPSSAWDAT